MQFEDGHPEACGPFQMEWPDREALQQSQSVRKVKTKLKTVTALLGRTEMQLEVVSFQ